MEDNITPKKEKNWLLPAILMVFVLGLFVRIIGLTEYPFTLQESSLASYAWRVSTHSASGTSSLPAYTGVTALLFYLLSATNFTARLWPVLLGSSMILVPYFWRDKLNARAALILSIALAFWPVFVIYSRQVSGPIYPAAGLAWALTFWHLHKPAAAAGMLALVLLGGYYFWPIVILVAAIGLVTARKHKPASQGVIVGRGQSRSLLPVVAGGFITVLLLVSTHFLLYPAGLSGIGSGLLEFAALFARPFEIHPLRSIYLILAYSLLPLVFTVLALVQGSRQMNDNFNRAASLLAGILLVATILLGRQEPGLSYFVTLILWIVGARWLGDQEMALSVRQRTAMLALAAFMMVVLIYLGMVLPDLLQNPASSPFFLRSGLALLAGVVLLVVTYYLVGLGWEFVTSRKALLLAAVVFLGFVSLSNTFTSLDANAGLQKLMFMDGPIVLPTGVTDPLLETFDAYNLIVKPDTQFEIQTNPDDLAWFAREFNASREPLAADPEVILSLSEEMPETRADYRGARLPVYEDITWVEMTPRRYLDNLFIKDLPLHRVPGVLWVRTDLFTGAN